MNGKIRLAACAAIATLATALCAPAYAASDGVDATPSTGFYVGGFGGYGWVDADTAGGNFDLDGNEWGVFAGYDLGAVLDPGRGLGIAGAIEAHYAWSNADSGPFSKEHEWGLNFRPGLAFVSQAMGLDLKPYAILGWRRAEIESAGTDTDHDGFDLGIGTELVAMGDIGIRLDYSHVFYEEKGGIDPDENDLRLGLAYHF